MRIPGDLSRSFLLAACLGLAGAATAAEPLEAFLSTHCVRCHGPDKAEAGLDLSFPATAAAQIDLLRRRIAASELAFRMQAAAPELIDLSGETRAALVVFAGEFGRTPLGENRGGSPNVSGRDHHPFAFSLWMAGGGVKGGLTYGATDEIGWSVVEKPVHVNDFQATLLRLFGFRHDRFTVRHHGLDARLTGVGGRVVEEWIA